MWRKYNIITNALIYMLYNTKIGTIGVLTQNEKNLEKKFLKPAGSCLVFYDLTHKHTLATLTNKNFTFLDLILVIFITPSD